MSTVALVEKIAPEICGDSRIPFALLLAATKFDASCYGDQSGNAQAIWAAHFVTLQERAKQAAASTSGIAQGATGIISSVRAGELSISWDKLSGGSQNQRDQWLLQTTYGSMLISLRDSLACSAPFLTDIC